MRFPVGVIVLVSLAAAFVLNPARTEEKTPQYVCCTETELVYSNGWDRQVASSRQYPKRPTWIRRPEPGRAPGYVGCVDGRRLVRHQYGRRCIADESDAFPRAGTNL